MVHLKIIRIYEPEVDKEFYNTYYKICPKYFSFLYPWRMYRSYAMMDENSMLRFVSAWLQKSNVSLHVKTDIKTYFN